MRILFDDLAPAFKDRHGGYTRIIRLNQRPGDASPQAILEWVELPAPAPAKAAAPASGTEGKSQG